VSAASSLFHLMVLPSLLVTSQGRGLINLPLRATFSPTHPLARRDVPLARARGVRDRALREHRRSTSLKKIKSVSTENAITRIR